MEQRLFVRCNACGVHAAPFDCAVPLDVDKLIVDCMREHVKLL